MMKREIVAISSSFNVDSYEQMDKVLMWKNGRIDTIIHMAAATNTREIETKEHFREKAIITNIVGTSNVVRLCMKRQIKLIYISTDYVFKGERGDYTEDDDLNPVNFYAWSKLGGESAVRMYENSLIVRLSFCHDRFPYNKAFADQISTRMPVSDAAYKLSKLIEENPTGVRHLAGTKQSIFDLARTLSPSKDIEAISIKDLPDYNLPSDTSLLSKYDEKQL